MLRTDIRRRGTSRVLLGLAAACLLWSSACGGEQISSGQDPLQGATNVSTLPSNVWPSGCAPASDSAPVAGGTEVVGAGAGGFEAFALFESAFPPPANEDLVVWWRVGGEHGLKLTLVDSAGREIKVPSVFPDPSKTDWTRPGDPWRSTIRFPQAGCWRIAVERGLGRHGDVWVQVG